MHRWSERSPRKTDGDKGQRQNLEDHLDEMVEPEEEQLGRKKTWHCWHILKEVALQAESSGSCILNSRGSTQGSWIALVIMLLAVTSDYPREPAVAEDIGTGPG